MQLSRVIPRHTRTEKFRWVKADWMLFSTYREARVRMNMTIQTDCYWCKETFDYDTMLAIAQPEKGRNKLLCQDCAKTLQASTLGEEVR